MCDQAAGLSRCLTRVQDSMVAQLKTLHHEKGKGKSSERSQHAVDKLDYLVTTEVSPKLWPALCKNCLKESS